MSALVNAFLERDEERVCLLHRAPDGKLLVHRAPADYAIYLRADEVPDDVRRAWRRDPLCRGYRVEGEWLRTRWRSWQGRREKVQSLLDKGITPYEGDVSPVKRWLADHPDVQIQRPRRVYMDLETDSRVRIRDAKEGEARILVWSLVDEEGKFSSGCLAEDTDQAERMLLQALYQALTPFDQVCSWNGDDFDFPVLKERTKRRKIDTGVLRRWLWMDHMLLFERMNMQVAQSGEEKQSKALDAVAWAQLGEGKQDFDARRTYDAWASGGEERERLVRYCVHDSDLMRRIEKETGYLALHQTIAADVCGVFDDTWALRPTAQMDAFLLRLGRRRGQHFPTVFRSDEPQEAAQYLGSYNKDPPLNAGVLENVHVIDFSSMYPSIMISWNMSWETVVDGPVNGPIPAGMCRAPKTGVCFRTDVTGLVPESCEHFLAKRKEWSARRADLAPGTPEAHDAERWTNAYKVAPNSFYGAQGNAGCRFYRRSVAESVSQTGAWLAQKTEHVLTERYPGARIIYVDTDGLWIVGLSREEITEAVAWLNAEVYPKLLRDCGCVKNFVKIAYEKAFSRVVFCKAKSYTARYLFYKGKAADAESRPEIKGIAYKRGDQARLTMHLQAEAIDLLMGGMKELRCGCGHEYSMAAKDKSCPTCGKPRSKLARVQGPTDEVAHYEEMLTRWRAHVMEGELAVEQVQTVKGLSRPLEEYATKKTAKGKDSSQPPHVRVGKVLEARGEDVGEGTRIAYVVVDGDATPQGVIPACDYKGECDRRHLWGDVVYAPTQRLLEAAFPKHDWKQFGPPKKERKKKGSEVQQELGGIE